MCAGALASAGAPCSLSRGVAALRVGNCNLLFLLAVTLGNLLGGLGLAWVYQRIYLKD